MKLKFFFFLVLYSLQGIPHGLESRFLPLLLRSKGVSLKTLGYIKLCTLPWLLKFLYAPIVSGYFSYRTWVVSCLLILSFICFILESNEHFISIEGVHFELPLIFVSYNFFCAVLDIAVDALAINKLGTDDIFVGNVVQVVGYRIGMFIGAGFFIFLADFVKASTIFMFLTLYYVFWAAISYLSPILKYTPIQINQAHENLEHVSYFKRIQLAVNVPRTKTLAIFLIMYKMGENALLCMVPIFLVDNHFTNVQIGLFASTIGQCAAIFGATYSATYIKSQRSLIEAMRRLSLVIFILSIPIPVLAYSIQENYSSSHREMLFYLICGFLDINLLVNSCLTTCGFSLMMQCTMQNSVSEYIYATHYTILSVVDNVGRLLINFLAPFVIDKFGYFNSFSLFVFMNIIPYVFLSFKSLNDQLNFEKRNSVH